jgi:hypothetical protein
VGLQALAEGAGIRERRIERVLEKFLIELANLQLTREAFGRVLKQFPAFFPPSLQHPYAVAFLRREIEKENISFTIKSNVSHISWWFISHASRCGRFGMLRRTQKLQNGGYS